MLYRLKRMKVCGTRKRLAHYLDMLNAIQAKEALSLSQVTVADGVPEPLVRDNTVGIKHSLCYLRTRGVIAKSYTPPSLDS